MWMLQYRGRMTDNLTRQLSRLENVKITTALTLRKLKTLTPSLKTSVPKQLRSRLIYQIECPGCQASYVGYTVRHLKDRFSEHGNIIKPVGKHFNQCIGGKPLLGDVSILQTSCGSKDFLEALESLYIREQKPLLNTQMEYRSRTLTLVF